MNKVVKEKAALKGIYTFTKAFLETPEQYALNDEITRLRASGSPFLHLVRRLNEICRTERVVYENLIPTTGRTVIANNLTASSPTDDPRINRCALGSSTTAPANSDTQLGTETYRNAVASETNASNVAYVTGFFSATETTGTYREAGLFINGSAAANNGKLFSHVAINITKSGTETLTLDWTITIS